MCCGTGPNVNNLYEDHVWRPCILYCLASTGDTLLFIFFIYCPKKIAHLLTDWQSHTVLLILCSVQLYGDNSRLGLQIFNVYIHGSIIS
jgi:hypothetical protein